MPEESLDSPGEYFSMTRLLFLLYLLLLTGCVSGVRQQDVRKPLFLDVTGPSKIGFVHDQYERPRSLPDVMGSGCGWADYDGDGREDIFFVNGSRGFSKLYRNRGGGVFEDVTESAGLAFRIWGMGCNWADYDNDGYPDLAVTSFGGLRLFHNEGGRRFRDVTARAGLRCGGFLSACAWGDYDRDGFIDLYVGQSAPIDERWLRRMDRRGWPKTPLSMAVNAQYEQMAGDIDFLPELVIFSYPEGHSNLYRNKGDGTFEDVTARASLSLQQGRTWQPVFCDFDDDGWCDLFISNDGTPNSLYLNNRNGTFRDVSISSYVANMHSNMGVAVGDYNGTLALSFYIPHWYSQGNVLYRNNLPLTEGQGATDIQGAGGSGTERRAALTFTETAQSAGLRAASMNVVGFGPVFFDYDNDADLDLLVINGHTHPSKSNPRRLIPFRPFLYANDGKGKFADAGGRAGGFFLKEIVGRGAAAADFDGDGRMDIAATQNNGAALLVRNNTQGGHWLEIRLRGTKSNRDALGARVLVQAGGCAQIREVLGGEGYLGNHTKTLHFGLGEASQVEAVHIRWPSGLEERTGALEADALYLIEEGRALAAHVWRAP
jgi:hypothetical protein